MPGLRKDRAKPLMDFSLEGLERNTFSIYADIPVTSTFRDDSITEDLAVPDAGDIKEFAVLDREHHLERGHTADVAIDADEIHVAVVGERGLEEYGVCGHICHL